METIPTNLTYNGSSSSTEHLSTFDAWNMLMNNANTTLNIASYYWTLRGFGNTSGPTDNLVIVNIDYSGPCVMLTCCRVLRYLKRLNKLLPEE